MALIIEGMKKPENCWVCRIEQLIENCPCRLGINNASEYKTKRHPACPIKDMDKHGRMIDADILLESFNDVIRRENILHRSSIECIIKNAPTVVEANK